MDVNKGQVNLFESVSRDFVPQCSPQAGGRGEACRRRTQIKTSVTGRPSVSTVLLLLRSSGFDVGRVVPTCPAALCQEITTPSLRSPTGCWEKHFLFDVLKKDLQRKLAFHLLASLSSVIHPRSDFHPPTSYNAAL